MDQKEPLCNDNFIVPVSAVGGVLGNPRGEGVNTKYTDRAPIKRITDLYELILGPVVPAMSLLKPMYMVESGNFVLIRQTVQTHLIIITAFHPDQSITVAAHL